MNINSSQDTAVQAEKLRQLCAGSKASITSSTLLAALLAYTQSGLISSSVIIIWFTLIVVIGVSRAALAFAFQRISVKHVLDIRTWFIRFRIGVLAVAVVWGAAGIVLFPLNDPQHQLFLIFMLAGLSAGGVVAFSADQFSAVLFSIISLLPIEIRLFSTHDGLSESMGMAGLLYLGFMVVSLRNINRNLTENIILHLEATEREDAIRTSEERYRLLLNHSPVAIIHFDRNLEITYCNERFADILQNSVQEVLGSTMETLKDQAIIEAAKRSLKGEIAVHEGQYRSTFSDTNKWIDMTCGPSRDETGRVVGGIAIVRDITDKKQAEEMLRISAIAFESQSGMIVTSGNGLILRVNRAFTALTGYCAHEMLGQTPKLLSSGRHDKSFYKAMWDTLKETGHWQGEIWNRHKNGLVFAEWLSISAVTAPDGSVSHYVGTYADITENKDAVAEIHRLAYYDPLTHLPNRRMLQDRLGQELAAVNRKGVHGAILFLDLDNFKSLNDTRGHDAGDQLLLEVARRLRAAVREGDIVGRLGGDEFVVLLQDLSAEVETAAIQTKQIGEKVLAELIRPYQFDDYEFQCSASIGVRLYHEPGTVEELLRHADIAMYQAKTAGGKSLCFFDPTMQTLVTARVDMEKDLRRALEQSQFKLYFQSQVIRNRHIVGAEVLIRWQHPEQGCYPLWISFHWPRKPA
jgi:diguanylate cyclase (GGDEF)-like protein/PAS domain S-box-containing protein